MAYKARKFFLVLFYMFVVILTATSKNSISNGLSDKCGNISVSISSKPLVSLSEQIKDSYTNYDILGSYDLHGDTIKIPEGCALVGHNAKITNGIILLQSGCRLESISLEKTKILILNASNVKISNISIVGQFTSKQLDFQKFMDASIFCSNTRNSEFVNIEIKNYRWGIYIFDSKNNIIGNITFHGVLDIPIDYNRNIKNSNYHDAIHLSNSHYNNIYNISAYNCGACVLLGRISEFNVIEKCKGDFLWDNGIYISSGNYNIVNKCSFKNVRGTGIKARGSCNSIENNIVSDVGVGYVLTGDGLAIGVDEYGHEYNGYGSKIHSNIVINAYFYGIYIKEQDGLPPYRFSVSNNNVFNRQTMGIGLNVFCDGANIIGNNLFCPKSSGVIIAQLPNKTSAGYIISENSVLSKKQGILVQKCKNAVFANNIIVTVR